MPRLRPSTWSIVLLVGAVTRANAAASFARPDARVFPDVFVWADTANVYVLRDGVEAASNAFQDNVSKPTPIEDLAQVSPHVFKFKRASFWPNFTLIVSDSGRALLVDCGLLDPEFLDETLEGMKKLYGLQAIDAVVVTHMHGDHFLIFGDPDDPTQTGHEAVVARNSAILEEGYIHGAELLARIKPDVIVGGHSFVMANPAALIERYRKWSYEMRDAFQALSPDPDYRYWFDPYRVRAYPYRTPLAPGETKEVTLHVRNCREGAQKHRIEVHAPPGVAVEPVVVEGEFSAGSRGAFPVRVTAAPDAGQGTHIVALDVTLDGKRYGQRFDFIVGIETRRPAGPRSTTASGGTALRSASCPAQRLRCSPPRTK